ncbi:MAG: hypothetical protein U0Y82_01385 [Thermoleophilia bacterium]
MDHPDDSPMRMDVPAEAHSAVGATLTDYERRLGADGYTVRVIRRDGGWLAVTRDFRPTRVNVAVEGESVVSFEWMG